MPLLYPISLRSIPSPGVLPFASESIHYGVGFEWLRNIGGMHVYQLLSNDHMEYVLYLKKLFNGFILNDFV